MITVKLDVANSVNPVPRRIIPRYNQLASFFHRTRYKIGATVYQHGRAAYAAELHESHGHTLDVTIWRKGGRVQERHLLDIRLAVMAEYAATYGLSARSVVATRVVQWRRDPRMVMTGETL